MPLLLGKRLFWCTVAGLLLEIAGALFLAAGFEFVSRILAIYPGSLVFYLLPRSITDRLSEASLFYVWFFSGALFWAIVLLGLSILTKLAFSRVRHGQATSL